MLTLHLEREPSDTQTGGILTMSSGRVLQSLECPWKNNKPFESCIPDGAYRIDPWQSPTHGECYIISGGTVGKTEGIRTYCLFHAATKVSQLQGCVALASSWNGQNLRDSGAAIKLFLRELNGKPAMLFISGLDEWG